MSCPGLHCGSCSGGAAAPLGVLLWFEGLAWVSAHIVAVAVTSAACGVASVAAVIALMRWQDRREAEMRARGPLLVTRADAAPLPPARHRGELPPVVNNYFYVADPAAAARVIRVIPGTAGDAITERK